MKKKGRLRKSDYFLIVALPSLFVGAGLLHSSLDELYARKSAPTSGNPPAFDRHTSAGPRLTLAIEMLWVTIYTVKASFFAQFKFHKPPYAYISPRLTRYYWVAISVCGATFLLTLIVSAVLCPSSAKCRYFGMHNTIVWQVVLTSLDIVTDLLVISIPVFLIWMAGFTISRAIINTSFKSLSILTVAVASCRLAFQYDGKARRVDYVSLSFWLAAEAAVAVIAASISSYRIVLLDYLTDLKSRQDAHAPAPQSPRILATWRDRGRKAVAKITTSARRTPLHSSSELSIQQPKQPHNSAL
ncbi:Nn.00g044930.m01.CDS01 [Neocucurbitaria sp. VM-36]